MFIVTKSHYMNNSCIYTCTSTKIKLNLLVEILGCGLFFILIVTLKVPSEKMSYRHYFPASVDSLFSYFGFNTVYTLNLVQYQDCCLKMIIPQI